MKNTLHGYDLRKGRCSIPNQVYLVTSVTFHRTPFFRSFHAGRKVVRALRNTSENGKAETLAFVVMPDHIHWLLSLGQQAALSGVVGAMKRSAAFRINELSGTTGRRIWQRGFYDHALRSDESIPAIARYIVANPLRAGLVRRVGEYPLWDAIWL